MTSIHLKGLLRRVAVRPYDMTVGMGERVDVYILYIYIPRGPAEAVAFFVRQSGPLSRTADMPESSTGNTNRQELMSLRRPPGWISV